MPANTCTRDLVVVGSLNADLTARVRSHPLPGETVQASAVTVTPGGKGANQAVAATRLGARTAMLGRVGADAHAHMLLDALWTDGIDTAYVSRDSAASTGTALITVADSGENHIIVSAAANAQLSPADVAEAEPLISAARVVSLVCEIPVDTVVAAARVARKAGSRVVLNLSPVVEVPADVLAFADPLIVNEHEARELLRRNGERSCESSGIHRATALRRLGAQSVVITLGAAGAAVADTDHTEHIPGLPANTVDTTGAGDAFAATVAWRLSHGDMLATAAHWAIRVSAHSVQHPGTHPSYPTPDTLSERARPWTAPFDRRSSAARAIAPSE